MAPSIPEVASTAPSGAHNVQGLTVAPFTSAFAAAVGVSTLSCMPHGSGDMAAPSRGPHRSAGHQVPNGTRSCRLDLASKRDRSVEARKRDLSLVIMVAKTNTELMGNGALLDATDKHIHVLLNEKGGQFERVRVVHDNGPF